MQNKTASGQSDRFLKRSLIHAGVQCAWRGCKCLTEFRHQKIGKDWTGKPCLKRFLALCSAPCGVLAWYYMKCFRNGLWVSRRTPPILKHRQVVKHHAQVVPFFHIYWPKDISLQFHYLELRSLTSKLPWKSKAIHNVKTLVDLTEEGLGQCEQPVAVLNICSLLTFLFSDKFGVKISERALAEFWDHACSHYTWGPNHPGAQTHIPLGVYGDSARYTNQARFQEKLLCITLNLPLWAPRSVRSSRFLVFSIRESLMVDYVHTVWPIYSYIASALNELFQSGIPVKGIGCNPEARLRFTVTELRGDWAFHCDALQLNRRWSSNNCCFKCPATLTSGPFRYTDFEDNAGWVGNEFSHVQFLNLCLKPGAICDLVLLDLVFRIL